MKTKSPYTVDSYEIHVRHTVRGGRDITPRSPIKTDTNMNTTTAPRIIGKDDLDIEKIRAEITHLLEETRRKEDERERLRAETLKMHKETQKMQSEILKFNAETKWHPIRYVAGVFGAAIIFVAALVGLVKAFL